MPANSMVLNNVYNHYISTYAPKGTTPYDTHKKSELRSIYNTIIKLNKESPSYLVDSSEETQAYAIDMKENARALKNVIASVSGNTTSDILGKKSVTSSDDSIVSAKYIGADSDSEDIPSFEVEVHSLAKPQNNLGHFLSSDKRSIDTGTYSFDIHVGELDYEFQFNINNGDTNRDVQNKLSRLINKSNIGIEASVEEDETGSSSLKLSSTNIGTPEDKEFLFKVSDEQTSKSTGIVDYLGIGDITQLPKNSSFLLNGTQRSSASNTFTVDKRFELTLNGVTTDEQPTTIGLKTDVESLTENIESLVDGYNSYMDKVSGYADSQPRSQRLHSEMGNIVYHFKNELDSLGLNVQENGTIQLDKNLLQQTAREDDALERFRSVKDLTNSVLRKTGQVSLNPMHYVDKTVVAYKNPGKSFANPYITSLYSGMMFNSYC